MYLEYGETVRSAAGERWEDTVGRVAQQHEKECLLRNKIQLMDSLEAHAHTVVCELASVHKIKLNIGERICVEEVGLRQ